MADPKSVAEWLQLAKGNEAAARLLAEDRKAAKEALFHVGTAVECALKALIMKNERLNTWPSKESRKELHTHNLRALMKVAGLSVARTDPTAPSWHVVLNWDRNQSYDPKPMPRKVARQWVEAAFGDDGAVTWIRAILA